MRTLITCISLCLFAAANSAVWAVRPSSDMPATKSVQPTELPKSAPTSDVRGGTITAIDAGAGTITIDGAPYRASLKSVRYYGANGAALTDAPELKVGQRLRFVLTPGGASGTQPPEISNLWMLDTAAPRQNAR